jgi:hypothetical protein
MTPRARSAWRAPPLPQPSAMRASSGRTALIATRGNRDLRDNEQGDQSEKDGTDPKDQGVFDATNQVDAMPYWKYGALVIRARERQGHEFGAGDVRSRASMCRLQAR